MYDELYEKWKSEKENAEIQQIPKDFFTRLAEYVKKIREEGRMLDNRAVKTKLLRHELKNVERLAEELVAIRHKKVLRKIANGETLPKEVFTIEEEKMYSGLSRIPDDVHGFVKDLLRGLLAHATLDAEKPKKMVLRFVRDIPAIVGADMKTYGPFKPEDVGLLPAENARVLIKQGVAVEVESK